MEYGVGNLTELTDYDNNYVTLSRSLARIAELLTEQGLKKEAAAFLEFGIATHTDIGKNKTVGEEQKAARKLHALPFMPHILIADVAAKRRVIRVVLRI